MDVIYFMRLDGKMKSFIGGELRSRTADDKQGQCIYYESYIFKLILIYYTNTLEL